MHSTGVHQIDFRCRLVQVEALSFFGRVNNQFVQRTLVSLVPRLRTFVAHGRMTSSVWHRALVALSGCTLLLTCAAHHSPFDTPTLLRSVHQATCLNSMFVQTPAQTSGPFYLPAPERADITEGKPGTPLNLTVIVRDKNCKAFPAGTRVSIWHTDSSGLYSGYETAPDGGNPVDARGDMFMRGELPTNVDGRVTFNTIVPGWYRNVG